MVKRKYVTAIELFKNKGENIKKDYHNGLKREEISVRYNCSHNTLMTVIGMLGFPVANSFQKMAKQQLNRVKSEKRLRALPIENDDEL